MVPTKSKPKQRDWIFVAALPSSSTSESFSGPPTSKEEEIAKTLFQSNGVGKFKLYGQTSSKVIVRNGICSSKNCDCRCKVICGDKVLKLLSSGNHVCDANDSNVLEYGFTSNQKNFLLDNLSKDQNHIAIQMKNNNLLQENKIPQMLRKITNLKSSIILHRNQLVKKLLIGVLVKQRNILTK